MQTSSVEKGSIKYENTYILFSYGSRELIVSIFGKEWIKTSPLLSSAKRLKAQGIHYAVIGQPAAEMIFCETAP